MYKKIILIVLGLILLLGIIFAVGFMNSRGYEIKKQITTTASPVALWQNFEQVFSDSSQVKFWPNNYETITSTGLRQGSELTIAYHRLGVNNTQYYVINDVQIGRKIVYISKESNPLSVIETIEIVPVEGGSKLIWNVEYGLQQISLAGMYAKYFYLDGFFKQLEKNLSTVTK